MGSDIPTQSIDKKTRQGELRLAFASDTEVVKEHAQWWQLKMLTKIDTQTRMGPGAPFMVTGGGPVWSARVAEVRDRTSGQE